VESEAGLYVVPSSGDAEWFLHASRTGGAWVRMKGQSERLCAARVVHEPGEMARVQALFRSRYGEDTCRRYFEGTWRGLWLDPHQTPAAPALDQILQSEFDSVARGYDASIARKTVERYLKERAVAFLSRALEGLDPLLEVGPGTGYHTLPLLGRGHQTLAIDVSEQMLRQLTARAESSGLAGRLETRSGRLRDLADVCVDVPDGQFQGIYSAFGAFNLEPELRSAVGALTRLTSPGGRLVFTTINRPGLAPMVWEALMGRPIQALHRIRELVPVGGSRYPLELFVPSLTGWDRMLGPGFRRRAVNPVSVIAPPFESDRLVELVGQSGSRRAQALDARLARWPIAWMAAEWVFLTYDRTPTSGFDPSHAGSKPAI
jgi:SAM-dependent methyltransferase